MAMMKDTDRPPSSLPAVTEKILNANFASLSGFGGASAADYNNLLSDAKVLAKYCAHQIAKPEPNSFIERLKIEHAQLTGRTDALTLYLSRSDPGLSNEQRSLLEIQLRVMAAYRQILEVRLANLPRYIIERVASEPAIGEPVMVGGHDIDRDGPVPFDGVDSFLQTR